MIDKLEVIAGPGTVMRYGGIVAWADHRASAALVSFLAQSARNLASSIRGGRQVADHIAEVLSDRDPEPNVGFAVVGPSDHGWATLLHGPVQLWDGARWLAPTPAPGWLQAIVTPQPAVTVGAAGSPAPTLDPDSMWDLESGVVPGAGFVLVPAVRQSAAAQWPAGDTTQAAEMATAVETATAAPDMAGDLTTAFEPGHDATAQTGTGTFGTDAGIEAGAAVGAAAAVGAGAAALEALDKDAPAGPSSGENEPATAALDEAPEGGTHEVPTEVMNQTADAEAPAGIDGEAPTEVVPQIHGRDAPTEVITEAVTRAESAPAPRAAIPPGAVDLRSVEPPDGPPLPVGEAADVQLPGAPVVAGLRCPNGHLNRPTMTRCARCRADLTGRSAETVSGTRPALGSLVTDDGVVHRLDRGYVAGSAPGRDPTVSGGLARPLMLAGTNVAGSHAEIRLNGWDVVLLDRGSPGGTYVFEPGAAGWDRLKPFEPRVLTPGAHVAFGQRVVTYASPWV